MTYPSSDKILIFVEPHPTGGDAVVRITESKAIADQKIHVSSSEKVRLLRIKKSMYPHLTDEELLDEFKIVNWAVSEEDYHATK